MAHSQEEVGLDIPVWTQALDLPEKGYKSVDACTHLTVGETIQFLDSGLNFTSSQTASFDGCDVVS